MSRTKQQITDLLVKRRINMKFKNSTWADLVSAIQDFDANQKQSIVDTIVAGRLKSTGDILSRALRNSAKDKAVVEVEAMLINDSLSISELDSLI